MAQAVDILPHGRQGPIYPWWHHKMETLSALLALCVGKSPVTGEFPAQRPVTRSFDVSFDLCLSKRFCKQSRRQWFETSPRSLWCHCNAYLLCQYCGCNWPWDLSQGISNHSIDLVPASAPQGLTDCGLAKLSGCHFVPRSFSRKFVVTFRKSLVMVTTVHISNFLCILSNV